MRGDIPFTVEELNFLRRQGLATEDFLDVRGMSQFSREQLAERTEKRFMYGAPCRLLGHRLRTKAYHCIQCDTARIAFMLRHYQTSYVYLAGSILGRAIKVGVAESIFDREHTLNSQSYGGYDDWRILAGMKVVEAGLFESRLKSKLSKFSIFGMYDKNGQDQESIELVRYSFAELLSMLSDMLAQETILDTYFLSDDITQRYEFV